MFKFIKTKNHHQGNTEEQKELQKELFSYTKTVQHGFPRKPTALAWDPILRLMALGTATGVIKVFGKPGVEFYGEHQHSMAVTKLVFLPSQGRVVSLCEDNSLHLWVITNTLVGVKFPALGSKLKKISTLCVNSNKKHLLLGSEGGNIYILDLSTFTLTRDIIYQDVVMKKVSQDYKLNPGAVECIEEQPNNHNKFLIGYNRGLMVLWDLSTNTAIKTFIANQQLESLSWLDNGQSFISSHNDGSYITWNIEDMEKMAFSLNSTMIYGPFPCKTIPKILARNLKGKPLIIFSGGLGRATHSDKYTVSVLYGNDKHVCFDFTSKVIDFFLIDSKPQKEENSDENLVNGGTVRQTGEPEALIVLAEMELVAIDLQCEEWKMISLPYLVSLHASAVTCTHYVTGVAEELWDFLMDAGRAQTVQLYSSKPWPVDGGDLYCAKETNPRRELLLTGHEDGSVCFWNAGGVTLTPIYKFSSSQFFLGDDLEELVPDAEDMEEEWPPFRKTGVYDPYSDDPRLTVKKIAFCGLSGTLAAAGRAGQVLVATFDTEALEEPLKITTMNIVNDRDGFAWKGYSQLTTKTDVIRQPRGFQCTSFLQLYPPGAVTCCTLQTDWGLVSAGTAHGLALFDYVRNRAIMVKCTLSPNDLTGSGDPPISRRKSFKKSLRESFRRLRRGKSLKRTINPQSPVSQTVRKQPTGVDMADSIIVERHIEARPKDNPMGSIVRCLYFAKTFLINSQSTHPTLWAGTNNGTVFAFAIAVPGSETRETDDVVCQLAKEIHLKHRAPVISIAVVDGLNKPLPEPLEVEHGVSESPDMSQAHRVVIASEEQIKIFTLPSLKPFGKLKITAHEGATVLGMSFATFNGHHPDKKDYSEIDLLCLTNLGDCLVFTIPDLKRQLNVTAIEEEDIYRIWSLVFTKNGEALYLHSSSEMQRISLSTNFLTQARCFLTLPKEEGNEAAVDETSGEPQYQSTLNLDCLKAAMVNGNNESKNNRLTDKTVGERKNIGETSLNMTVSGSVDDITIDSVRDYLGLYSVGEVNRHLVNMSINKTVIAGLGPKGGVANSPSTYPLTNAATNNKDSSIS